MSDALQVSITGLSELESKLTALGQEFAAKSIVGAAYTANKQVEDNAKAFIAADGLIDTGLLHSAVKRKKIIYAKDGVVVIITGISKKVRGTDRNGKPRVPWRYANVLEPRFNFMKDAMIKARDSVVSKFVDDLQRRIKKYTTGGSK